MVRYNYFLRH